MDYTSTAHPWFVQARSSRTSPHHDWYVWRDGPPDLPPNDWTAFFSSGSAWTFVVSTRRWYLHYFTAEQPELNWANPQVRRAMHDVMRFWLARGVAGFRLDVISFLSKPEHAGNLPEEFRAISALTFAETGDRRRPSLADIRAMLRHWDEMLVPAGAWPPRSCSRRVRAGRVAPHAGFTTGEPWILVNPDHREVDVEARAGVPGSVLEHYRALLRLRREREVLRRGEASAYAFHATTKPAGVRARDARRSR